MMWEPFRLHALPIVDLVWQQHVPFCLFAFGAFLLFNLLFRHGESILISPSRSEITCFLVGFDRASTGILRIGHVVILEPYEQQI